MLLWRAGLQGQPAWQSRRQLQAFLRVLPLGLRALCLPFELGCFLLQPKNALIDQKLVFRAEPVRKLGNRAFWDNTPDFSLSDSCLFP